MGSLENRSHESQKSFLPFGDSVEAFYFIWAVQR